MDFVGAGANGGLGSENGPILYNEPNRTSAIDDIRSVVIYIFIITIFVGFFLILPGIRNEKFPTFLCITTSLIVTSIILVSLFGTTWHVGEAPISAAYKAFSRDRIQGDLSVKIGLQSVNITLRAHKYYILHDVRGPMIMYNTRLTVEQQQQQAQATSKQRPPATSTKQQSSSLAHELLLGRTSDGVSVDTELEVDEVFPDNKATRRTRSSPTNSTLKKRETTTTAKRPSFSQKFSVERVNVDINYNERFYWIEPNQMRQEHHNALERGLPYPILTVVEYLSQDEAGFSWSRQYRAAGYYCNIILWLSLCVCALMFFLHCAAPKYGIYTMQCLGCLLLFANFTYATLVPKGDRKLVIPFEGQPLTFQFGWNFWLVLTGGCLSFVVGTIIVIIDKMFPNFIFTTILDVDFDSHHNYYKHQPHRHKSSSSNVNKAAIMERAAKPPFFEQLNNSSSAKTNSTKLTTTSESESSSISNQSSVALTNDTLKEDELSPNDHHLTKLNSKSNNNEHLIVARSIKKRSAVGADSFEPLPTPIEVFEEGGGGGGSNELRRQIRPEPRNFKDGQLKKDNQEDHYSGGQAGEKSNLKSMHQQLTLVAGAKQSTNAMYRRTATNPNPKAKSTTSGGEKVDEREKDEDDSSHL